MIKGDGLLKNQRPNCDTTEYFENALLMICAPHGHWTYHMYLHVRDIQLNRSSVYRPLGQLYNTKIICLKMKMYKKSYRIFIHINT